MIPYRTEKVDNAICFFATEHKKRSKKLLTQTYLYKYLAFLDFLSTKRLGIPALDLEYKAMERGPVPSDIYNKRYQIKTGLYEFVKDEFDSTIYYVKPRAHPRLDYFSAFELEIMTNLVSKYAKEYSKTKEICEDSHNMIQAWKRTVKNQIIDYVLTFNGNLLAKKAGLTEAEEKYLEFRSMKNALHRSRHSNKVD